MGPFTDLIASTAGPAGAALQQVLDAALAAAPEAVEGVSYGTAALRYRGRPLIGVGVAKTHLSLFPFSAAVVAAVSADLPAASVSKGTLRFTAVEPLPPAIITMVVKLRMAEIEAAG